MDAPKVEGKETWEMQTGGTVYVESLIDPVRGVTKMLKASGKGGRVRISAMDRKLAQERTRDKKHDPFTNGLMLRVDDDQQEDPDTASPSAMSDAGLTKLFSFKQQARFRAAIGDLTEVSLRRLKDLAAENEDVTSVQNDIINTRINDEFSVNRGKDASLKDASAEQIQETFEEQKLSGR